jgi:hypothetical protein
VVVSSRKVLFYNTENDKQNADPIMVLDIEWVNVTISWYLGMIHLPTEKWGDKQNADPIMVLDIEWVLWQYHHI